MGRVPRFRLLLSPFDIWHRAANAGGCPLDAYPPDTVARYFGQRALKRSFKRHALSVQTWEIDGESAAQAFAMARCANCTAM